MKTNKFPPGWNEKRVKSLIAHYEKQSDEEAIAEDEAAREDRSHAVVLVPKGLVPQIRQLIAKHDAKRRRAA